MAYVGDQFDAEVRRRLNPRNRPGPVTLGDPSAPRPTPMEPGGSMPGPVLDDPNAPVGMPAPTVDTGGYAPDLPPQKPDPGRTPPYPAPFPEPKPEPGQTPPYPAPLPAPKLDGPAPLDAFKAQVTNQLTSAPAPTTNLVGDEPAAPDLPPGEPQLPTGNPSPSPQPPTGPATPEAPSAWDPGDPRGSFSRLMQGVAPSSANLIAKRAELAAAGWDLEPPNAMGIVSKIRNRSTGEVFRVGGHFDSAPSEGFPMTWEWVGQGGGDGGGGGAPSGPTAPGQSDFQRRIREMLLQRLAIAGQPVDTNSEEITAPLEGARLEQDRGLEQEKKALAERAYAQGGLNTDELARGVTQSRERGATNLANFRGNAISKAFADKRAELQTYMQYALAAGDAESAREIQLYIANLDAALRREGLYNQRDIEEARINNSGGPA